MRTFQAMLDSLQVLRSADLTMSNPVSVRELPQRLLSTLRTVLKRTSFHLNERRLQSSPNRAGDDRNGWKAAVS
jgi:hypothetical protein